MDSLRETFRRLNSGEKVIAAFRIAFITWMVLEVYFFCTICPTEYTPWAVLAYLLVTCLLMPLWESSGRGSQIFWAIVDVLLAGLIFLSVGNPLAVSTPLFYIAVVWGARFLSVPTAILHASFAYAVFALLLWVIGIFSFGQTHHYLAMLGMAIYTSLSSANLRENIKERHKRELLLKELKNSFQEQTAAARELEKMNTKLKSHALALEDSQAELVRRNQELGLLTEVLKITSSTLDLNKLLEQTILKTVELFGVDAAFALVWDADQDVEPQVVNCCCMNREDCLRLAQKIRPTLSGSREVLVWSYGETPPLSGTQDFFLNLGITGFLATPLVASDVVVGMMALINSKKSDFTLQEQEFFNIVSSQLSLALDKAQLYQRLRQQAITDGLTNLYNVRHFKERLQEELAKVERRGSCLSLLMIDIDWFKEFNDTFGHQTGDAVLCKAARDFTDNVREGDLVARYGGEEFTVILPETSHQDALHMAQRLRTRFKEGQNRVIPGLERPITLSIGVATYPLHAGTVNDLVELADRAMYRAKALGKDRVCSIEETK